MTLHNPGPGYYSTSKANSIKNTICMSNRNDNLSTNINPEFGYINSNQIQSNNNKVSLPGIDDSYLELQQLRINQNLGLKRHDVVAGMRH